MSTFVTFDFVLLVFSHADFLCGLFLYFGIFSLGYLLVLLHIVVFHTTVTQPEALAQSIYRNKTVEGAMWAINLSSRFCLLGSWSPFWLTNKNKSTVNAWAMVPWRQTSWSWAWWIALMLRFQQCFASNTSHILSTFTQHSYYITSGC